MAGTLRGGTGTPGCRRGPQYCTAGPQQDCLGGRWLRGLVPEPLAPTPGPPRTLQCLCTGQPGYDLLWGAVREDGGQKSCVLRERHPGEDVQVASECAQHRASWRRPCPPPHRLPRETGGSRAHVSCSERVFPPFQQKKRNVLLVLLGEPTVFKIFSKHSAPKASQGSLLGEARERAPG